MISTVIFVANGFTKDNIRLQPWRYVYELASSRTDNCNVYIITEGESEEKIEQWGANLTVIQTRNLSVKQQGKLKKKILSLNPEELWWSTTTRTLAFYPLLSSVNCRRMAFITSPLYTWLELFRASFAGVPFYQTKVLWRQRLVPRFLFRWMLNKDFIERVFVQSKKNQMIIEKLGVSSSKISLIPVGINKEDLEPVNPDMVNVLKERYAAIDKKVIYLYFGALRPIRGFDALINAFPEVVNKNPETHLIVLARGAEEEKCKKLSEKLYEKGLEGNVTVIGGWLTREEVWSYIEFSDVAVLPFILVPSDIPIAVLEAMARGKPVVVSNVDGLPEMVRNRGLVINPLNKREFSNAMLMLANNAHQRKVLGDSAKDYMENYPKWNKIGAIVENAIS